MHSFALALASDTDERIRALPAFHAGEMVNASELAHHLCSASASYLIQQHAHVLQRGQIHFGYVLFCPQANQQVQF